MAILYLSNNAVNSIKANDRTFSKSGSERSAILVIPSASGSNVKFCQSDRIESESVVQYQRKATVNLQSSHSKLS